MLTDKQKANRAYYAANAEKIKAQKRASYSKNPTSNPVKPAGISQSKALKKTTVKKVSTPTRSARQRIEDLKIAKELGIDVEGFIRKREAV